MFRVPSEVNRADPLSRFSNGVSWRDTTAEVEHRRSAWGRMQELFDVLFNFVPVPRVFSSGRSSCKYQHTWGSIDATPPAQRRNAWSCYDSVPGLFWLGRPPVCLVLVLHFSSA